MESIRPVEGRTVPKQIEVVNEADVMSATGELEPGVKAEEPAEALCSAGQCWKGATDEHRLSTAPQER